ncbi:hypothetical protein [Rhizobium nepotum]|uniref:hypothetical protein n=1 Tax=Rhizobium nepotum TaxID=1035271 RepID=UPI003CE7D69D
MMTRLNADLAPCVRPTKGELLKVGRGDHVFSAIVEACPGTFGMGLETAPEVSFMNPAQIGSPSTLFQKTTRSK